MDTTFGYKGTTTVTTTQQKDLSGDFTIAQKNVLAGTQTDIANIKQKTSEAEAIARAEAQRAKDEKVLQDARDAIMAQEEATNWRATSTSFSGIQKRDFFNAKKTELFERFKKGEVSEKYLTTLQDASQSDINNSLNEAQKETDDKAVDFISMALQDTSIDKNSLKATLLSKGVSEEAINKGALLATTIKAEKTSEALFGSLQGSDYKTLKETGIASYRSSLQETINAVKQEALSQGKNPDIDTDVLKTVKALEAKMKEASEVVSLKAGEEIAVATANGYAPIDKQLFFDHYKDAGTAITKFVDYSKESAIKAQSREILANPDAYAPSMIEAQKDIDKDFKLQYEQGSAMNFRYAVKAGNIEEASRLLANNSTMAKQQGTDIMAVLTNSKSIITDNPDEALKAEATYNASIDTLRNIRNAPNGFTAIKNMFGEKATEIETIMLLSDHVTNGNSLQAANRLEEYNKLPVKQELSKDVIKLFNDKMADDDYASLRPYKAELFKTFTIMNNLRPDGVDSELMNKIFDEKVKTDTLDVDGVSIHYANGRAFDNEVDSYLVEEIKLISPDAKYVQVDKDLVTIINSDGNRILYNAQVFKDFDMNRAFKAEKEDVTVTEIASDVASYAIQKVYNGAVYNNPATLGYYAAKEFSKDPSYYTKPVTTVSKALTAPWIASLERGTAKDIKSIEKLKAWYNNSSESDLADVATELRNKAAMYDLPEKAPAGMQQHIYDKEVYKNKILKNEILKEAKNIEASLGINKDKDILYRKNPMNIQDSDNTLKGALGNDKGFIVFDNEVNGIKAGLSFIDRNVSKGLTLKELYSKSIGKIPTENELIRLEKTVNLKRDTKINESLTYTVGKAFIKLNTGDTYIGAYDKAYKEYMKDK